MIATFDRCRTGWRQLHPELLADLVGGKVPGGLNGSRAPDLNEP